MKCKNLIRRMLLVLVIGWAVAVGATDGGFLDKFLERCEVLKEQKVEGTYEDVLAEEGWVLLLSEIRYVTAGTFFGVGAAKAHPKLKPEVADPVPAIVDFARQLEARGIEMVYMTVPVRPLIYPESVLGKKRVNSLAEIPDLYPEQTEFFSVLRQNGVKVIDLTDVFLAGRDSEHGPVFLPGESHWTSYGTLLAAREIAREYGDSDWLAKMDKVPVEVSWTSILHEGHIFRDIRTKGGLPDRPPDEIQLRRVVKVGAEGSEKFQRRNPGSPIILLGDSNTYWWMKNDAGFPQQLAAELGITVDVMTGQGGSGGDTNSRLNLIRETVANPEYLDNKKLVIWCFAARTTVTTFKGWLKTPLPPQTEGES